MLATVRNRRGVIAAVEPFDGETGRLHLVHLEYQDDAAPSQERLLWELEPRRDLDEPLALPRPDGDNAMRPREFDAQYPDLRSCAPCITLSYTEGEPYMAANQLVQARIDGAVKEEAAAVLAAMGLTVSDAVRLLLTKVAQEKALPFEPLIPNPVTIEAMKKARKGGLPRFDSVQALMDDLHEDD